MTAAPSASVPIQPRPDPDTSGFWEATARGELALCWCPACSRFLHPPLERCRDCGEVTAFRPVSGRGRVHSFIVVHRAVAPGYEDGAGQVIALVELDDQEGLRLAARLEGVDPVTLEIGAAVTAELVDLTGGDHRIAVFRPVSA